MCVKRAVMLGAAVCVFLVIVAVGRGVVTASLWAGVVGGVAGVVAAVAALWPLAMASRVLVPPELEVPEWAVGRPAEAGQVVTALLTGRGGTVGITTGLYGAGGFGKTTLARIVCADGRVRRRFRGGIYPVTLGRDVRGAAAVAAKVNDVIKLVAGEDATFTDPELAGRRLGALLDAGPRRLLVIDDVWDASQLTPFAAGSGRCARLVTTRMPALLGGQDVAVRVDQMTAEQARLLLTAGLPALDRVVADRLLAVTGRWPLLLRLVNKILANAASSGTDVAAAGAQLLELLRTGGPAVVDDLLGNGRSLDVSQPAERAQAVRATLEASISLLGPQDGQRFAELGVFAEDEVIPFPLAARLWQATAELSELQSSQLAARLAALGLVSIPAGAATRGGLSLHDVVRDYLRGELGVQRIARLNAALVDNAAATLPTVGGQDGRAAIKAAWWLLGPKERYLQDHLIGHLLEAGRLAEAEGLACDLRWLGFRVLESGPAAAAADLSQVGTQQALRLQATLARTAHLLAPADPPQAVIDVLLSRLAADPDWEPGVAALDHLLPRPRLAGRWPLPDLPDPTLRRVLTGHERRVTAVAAGPDSSWLASGSSDGTVRIWNLATGLERAVLRGPRGRVNAVVAAPDGSWLAAAVGPTNLAPVGARNKGVWVWDTATGSVRAVLDRRRADALAVAPDGSWLAAGGLGHRVQIWDLPTRRERAGLATGAAGVTALAVAPDGSWLATASLKQGVRIWDMHTNRERARLGTGTGWVTAMALAPDGTWLAVGCNDATLRILDTTTGAGKVIIPGHAGLVTAVAVTPDGARVVSGASDGTLLLWVAATGKQLASFTDHTREVAAVAISPDGSWLAAGYTDGTVRLWDTGSARPRTALPAYTGWVDAVAALPDGSGLVTAGPDRRVRIWDAATGRKRATLDGHRSAVAGIAVSPDGGWLATVGGDSIARIWETTTGTQKAAIETGHGTWTAAVAIAPDSSWLATGGYDGAIRLWDAATGTQRAAFGAYGAPTSTVTLQSDNISSTVVFGSARPRVLPRSVFKGRQRREAPLTSLPAAYAIAIAPDGTWVAAGGYGPAVHAWDVTTGKERFVLNACCSVIYAIAVSPDGTWLATSGDDGTVRIWDTTTGIQRTAITGHHGAVYTAAITPDGNWLATGGADRSLRIWGTADWQAKALMRVENAIHSCAWLPDGGITCAGPAGLYLFDFLTPQGPATPVPLPDGSS